MLISRIALRAFATLSWGLRSRFASSATLTRNNKAYRIQSRFYRSLQIALDHAHASRVVSSERTAPGSRLSILSRSRAIALRMRGETARCQPLAKKGAKERERERERETSERSGCFAGWRKKVKTSPYKDERP